MSNLVDPTAIFERLQNMRADGNTTNIFNISARYWLAISDDGQGLHHGA